MDVNGTGKAPIYLENGERTAQKVHLDQTYGNGVNHLVQLEKTFLHEQLSAGASNGKQNRRTNSLEVADNAIDELRTSSSSGVDKEPSDEQYEACSTPEKANVMQHSSDLEISQLNSSLSPLPWAKRG